MIRIQIFKRFDPQNSRNARKSEYWTFKEINSPLSPRCSRIAEINNIYLFAVADWELNIAIRSLNPNQNCLSRPETESGFRSLDIGIWDLFEIWCLSFVICPNIQLQFHVRSNLAAFQASCWADTRNLTPGALLSATITYGWWLFPSLHLAPDGHPGRFWSIRFFLQLPYPSSLCRTPSVCCPSVASDLK